MAIRGAKVAENAVDSAMKVENEREAQKPGDVLGQKAPGVASNPGSDQSSEEFADAEKEFTDAVKNQGGLRHLIHHMGGRQLTASNASRLLE